jgi:hypothetical protein
MPGEPRPEHGGGNMDEYVHRQFLKEEAFLEVHYETVDPVLPLLGHAWRPNFRCNDAVRDRRARLLAAGRLSELTFDSAVLFHGRNGLSSIRLYLRSSERFLVARITWVGAKTRVEILADCECRVAERGRGGRRKFIWMPIHPL